MTINTSFDVIIVGGSYAGLSAAMALGRSLRKVLIIDSGKPCNAQTPHSHNFVTQDGEKPGVIAEKAKQQVLSYPTIEFMHDIAVSGQKMESGFAVTTASGNVYAAKKLIFATGVKDIMPDLEGFDACWGISVIHCPYCHGYEVRNQETGILANGDAAMHYAQLILNLTKRLTIYTNGTPEFTAEQTATLKKRGIGIIETEIAGLEHDSGQLTHISFKDDSKTPADAVYARPPFTQHSGIPVQLGCELTELGYLKVDSFQKTTIDGIFACGDNTSMMRSVANAVATGNLAGAAVNSVLAGEEF